VGGCREAGAGGMTGYGSLCGAASLLGGGDPGVCSSSSLSESMGLRYAATPDVERKAWTAAAAAAGKGHSVG